MNNVDVFEPKKGEIFGWYSEKQRKIAGVVVWEKTDTGEKYELTSVSESLGVECNFDDLEFVATVDKFVKRKEDPLFNITNLYCVNHQENNIENYNFINASVDNILFNFLNKPEEKCEVINFENFKKNKN